MDLLLWRHAAAQEAGETLLDAQCELTPRGLRQSARIAHWLNQHLPEGTVVLASPAVRAQQTAESLGRKVRAWNCGIEATAGQLLDAAGWPNAKRTVVLVGHQPALGQAAALALTGAIADWPMRKAGVWWLRRRTRDGNASTVLLCAQSPETL
jgi:phosphohistidine phosphatase